MSTTEATTKEELTAPNVWLVHVDESGEDEVRTGVGTTRRDDLSFTDEGELEESERSTTLVNPQYLVSKTREFEVSISDDAASNEGLQTLGVIDEDSKITDSVEDSMISSEDDEYIELAYFNEDVDFSDDGFDYFDDSARVRRYADVVLGEAEEDSSEVPPVWSLSFAINGGVWTDYSQAVES